jgi:TFIIF-interacting CTD phosphatase-like protein
MNNVLVHRVFKFTDEQPDTIPFHPSDTLLGTKFYTWKRPHLDEFIKRMFANYTVAVWSSAQGQNVEDLVDFVFGEKKKDLLFVWDQSHCTFAPTDNVKPIFYKNLDQVYLKYPQFNRFNTLLMDDSPVKVSMNHPDTWLQIKPWIVVDQEDEELRKILFDMKND